jgi:hypothetical protein
MHVVHSSQPNAYTAIHFGAGANALAANFYPISSRATGVSWALGVGRIDLRVPRGWQPNRHGVALQPNL